MTDPIALRSQKFVDQRGWFQSSYHDALPPISWVMQNTSLSHKNTIRGLHYQSPYAQNKLITVIQGEITDIILNINPASPGYGKWSVYQLSSDDEQLPNQLFVPSHYAHGFGVLSDSALVSYLTDENYHPSAEQSINPLSSTLDLPWGVDQPILSSKDAQAPEWSADTT